MKYRLLSIALLSLTSFSFAQSGESFWKASSKKSNVVTTRRGVTLPTKNLFDLDVNGLKNALLGSPKRGINSGKSNVIVSFPNAEGQMERFRILEASNMEPGLAERYPEIKSYVGQGIDNPASTIHFSVSPLGLQTMQINADQSAVFIEPYSQDLKTYTVSKKQTRYNHYLILTVP